MKSSSDHICTFCERRAIGIQFGHSRAKYIQIFDPNFDLEAKFEAVVTNMIFT